MHPSQWWDQRLEKIIEHQSCRNSHVNGVIALVDVNLAALSSMLSGCVLTLADILSHPLHWQDSSGRLEKVSRYADGES